MANWTSALGITAYLAAQCVCTTQSSAYTPTNSDKFKVFSFYIDETRNPQSIDDWFKDAAHNESVVTAVAAIVAYFGGNPAVVFEGAKMVPTARRQGAESWYTFYPGNNPNGGGDPTLNYCTSHVNMISANPHHKPGGRNSELELTIYNFGASAYTWTPKNHLGEGSSWIEARIDIVMVKGDQEAIRLRKLGVCKDPDSPQYGKSNRVMYRCGGDLKPCESWWDDGLDHREPQYGNGP